MVAVTNPGSHRSATDSDVANAEAPYLIRSLIYDMLNVLCWCKRITHIEPDLVKQAIEVARMKFELEKEKRKNRTADSWKK